MFNKGVGLDRVVGVSFMNGPESGWGRASLRNYQAKKVLRFQSLLLSNYFLTGEDLFILLQCQKFRFFFICIHKSPKICLLFFSGGGGKS